MAIKLIGGVLKVTSTVAPAAFGEFGMSTGTGRASVYVSGSSELLALEDEAVLIDGSNAMTGALDMGTTNKITNLADGTADSDGVNFGQLQLFTAGLDPKGSVRLATAAALPAFTQSGDHATGILTASAVGILTVDTVATVLGDRILVQNEASSDNGIYEVTTEGTAGVAFILTRTADFNTDDTGSGGGVVSAGAFFTCEEGADNDNQMFILTTNNPITVDTTTLVFSTFGAATVHSSLTGLSADDHGQYALLAGRGTGQTLIGGLNTGNDLTLRSNTSDDGNIVMVTGNDFLMQGDNEIRPASNNTGKVGTEAAQFAEIHAETVVQNDAAFVGHGHMLIATENGGNMCYYNAMTDEVLGEIAFDPISDDRMAAVREQGRQTVARLRA